MVSLKRFGRAREGIGGGLLCNSFIIRYMCNFRWRFRVSHAIRVVVISDGGFGALKTLFE